MKTTNQGYRLARLAVKPLDNRGPIGVFAATRQRFAPSSDETRAAINVLQALTVGLIEPLACANHASADQTTSQSLGERIAGISSAVSFRPRGRIGGDYFSAAEIRPGVGRYVIADVAGHDMAASVVVAAIRIARTALRYGPQRTAQQFIALLNDLLLGDLARLATFITSTIVEVDGSTGQVTSFNCGHPSPRVRVARGRDGARAGVRQLTQESTLPIGVVPDLHARPILDQIEPGDSIVLYTDGIIEALDERGKRLGITGLDVLIASAPPETSPSDLIAHIQSGIDQHRGRAARADDETLLVVQR